MSKRVFLSFRYADLNQRDNLVDLFQASKGPVEATPTYVTKDVAEKGADVVKAEITTKMTGCCGLLFVMGDATHSSLWIQFELAEAARLEIPCLAVRHPKTKGGLGPNQQHIKVLDWDPDLIAAHVAKWKKPE